ncbi:MAG: hypothetical protein UY31_C0072G0004 [Candidatus Wolfebacteria bacterium GW2011_GWE1_48_7]|uniref:Uncharacterized protein n=2 Tax=Candidatus Wolfeibacteriota TaxID=1752735 RepID=A0A0G4ARQ7_9BACT|nr:MAG: hypothetical protein UX70_C0001G0264 [Candidatus Wolfebacteria bacterium GW2011_GWB1_47_1]KKU59727.1 MAG: hypothetical protein UX83_C0002G0014 [Candidatus Wolfebacteria bacterium GW2011_GWE2_47_12]KKU65718.1 MAG: hypothetical protein UX90_C0002G0094 [Candidatus Wolfebacteria bacterium GW2011_GWD2_47_17]KKU97591.1 MAG: hypothetical protein UY31_C0072G0004 [Candidatus Wolfebacteria bacterium GW2011_GWE1_48_7]HAL24451.1 hypothetical protein [Candidatus Wolfebacteria bacterium]
MGIEEMWPQPGAAEENIPKGYEGKPNAEALLYKRGEYINKAAKEAIKMEKGELEAALEGDETAMRNLITVTSSILQGEHYGSDRSLTEEEGKEFEEEFPNDVIKGYVEGALEVYKREQELKK